MTRYTKEKINQTLISINKALELDQQKRAKMLELQTTLTRIGRAIDSEFWLDKIWKGKTMKQKTELFRNERCVKFQSSGSIFQDLRDFPFFAKKQWENDRKKLIKEGEIKA